MRINLTEKLPVPFQQQTTTPDLPGPYGSGGWTANDQSVLLYDEFDIWDVKPDGTVGAHDHQRRRTQAAPRSSAIGRSIRNSARCRPTSRCCSRRRTSSTRATGFYRAAFGSTAAPEKIVMMDKAFGAPTKAAKADTLVFTMSRFEEFPDLWVAATSPSRTCARCRTPTRSRRSLCGASRNSSSYINGDGRKLRAILTKPDNFDPSKKYPMMVYIYEELTQGLHSYSAPNVGTSINVTRYVSNGYVLLRPDIVYDTGYPGESAEKCVIPAVNAVVAQGFIDPKRIGIQGHSWGGLPDHPPDHADQHVRGGRGGRVGVEHDQRLRRHPLGHGHGAPVPVREDAEPDRRAAVGRAAASTSRTRRSSG